MKHSIKRQMITVFIGLLASMVLLLLIINVSFLEPYYISNKETQFIDMYEKLSQCMDKGTMEDKPAARIFAEPGAEGEQDSGKHKGVSDQPVFRPVEPDGLYRDVGKF